MSEFNEKNVYTDSETKSIYINTCTDSNNSSILEKTTNSNSNVSDSTKNHSYKIYKRIRKTIDISKTDSEKSDSDNYDSETSFINNNSELTETSDSDVEKLILNTSRKKVNLKQKFKNLILLRKRKNLTENHKDAKKVKI